MLRYSEVKETIIETVADYENVRPDDLPALVDKLDGEAFERLTATEGELTEPLTFEYLWYDVTILPNEEVVITP